MHARLQTSHHETDEEEASKVVPDPLAFAVAVVVAVAVCTDGAAEATSAVDPLAVAVAVAVAVGTDGAAVADASCMECVVTV